MLYVNGFKYLFLISLNNAFGLSERLLNCELEISNRKCRI